MTDFLQEVEDDLKRERGEKLWAKYSIYVYGLAALVIAIVGGYRYYDAEQTKLSYIAGATYERALQLSRENLHDDAVKALGGIVAEGGRYKDLARLKLASSSNDKEGATAALTALSKDPKFLSELRDISTLHLAYSGVDVKSYEDISALVEPLSKAGSPYRASALEILGLSAHKNGKSAEVSTHFNAILNEPDGDR
jgi:hypothetical protein